MNRGPLIRLSVWAVVAALVILLGRTIGYALNPTPIAELLRHDAGGPALPTIAAVSLALGFAAAAGICWLACLSVRERALLERRTLAADVPGLRLRRALGRAVVLWAVACPVGGLLEAYLHWRAGLGWHGLYCLVGPVHRDLLPIYGGLSLIAAAVAAAVEHVVAWMRRTVALIGRAGLAWPSLGPGRRTPHVEVRARRPRLTGCAARAPPAFS